MSILHHKYYPRWTSPSTAHHGDEYFFFSTRFSLPWENHSSDHCTIRTDPWTPSVGGRTLWHHTTLRECLQQSVRLIMLFYKISCLVYPLFNRYAARQLRDRCHNLVLSLSEYEANAVSDNMVQARNTVHEFVPRPCSLMSKYTKRCFSKLSRQYPQKDAWMGRLRQASEPHPTGWHCKGHRTLSRSNFRLLEHVQCAPCLVYTFPELNISSSHRNLKFTRGWWNSKLTTSRIMHNS